MNITLKNMRGFAVVCLMSFSLMACATPVQHNTPSGKVEVTINRASKATVKDRITNMMMDKGYSVTKSDDASIAFDRPTDNPMAQMFFGSRYDTTPNARIVYSIIQTKGAVRVVADCMIVTNPGSAFEQKTPLNRNASTLDVQKWLEDIKGSLEKGR